MSDTTREAKRTKYDETTKRFYSALIDTIEECHGIDITHIEHKPYMPSVCTIDGDSSYRMSLDYRDVPRLADYDNKETYKIKVTLMHAGEEPNVIYVTMDPVLDKRLEELRVAVYAAIDSIRMF